MSCLQLHHLHSGKSDCLFVGSGGVSNTIPLLNTKIFNKFVLLNIKKSVLLSSSYTFFAIISHVSPSIVVYNISLPYIKPYLFCSFIHCFICSLKSLCAFASAFSISCFISVLSALPCKIICGLYSI